MKLTHRQLAGPAESPMCTPPSGRPVGAEDGATPVAPSEAHRRIARVTAILPGIRRIPPLQCPGHVAARLQVPQAPVSSP